MGKLGSCVSACFLCPSAAGPVQSPTRPCDVGVGITGTSWLHSVAGVLLWLSGALKRRGGSPSEPARRRRGTPRWTLLCDWTAETYDSQSERSRWKRLLAGETRPKSLLRPPWFSTSEGLHGIKTLLCGSGPRCPVTGRNRELKPHHPPPPYLKPSSQTQT